MSVESTPSAAPNDTMREIALGYARLGWPVLPLCRPVFTDDGKPVVTLDGQPSCTHSLRGERCGGERKPGPGKIPIGAYAPHGAASATTDASTINRWFDDADRRGHALNLGLAMGHGRFALDVDIYKSAGALDELEEIVGKLPSTVEFHTGGGGVHLVFEDAVPGGIGQSPPRRRDGSVLPHIDVRSNNGYLVAPGSLHANGEQYRAELSSDPLDGVLPAPAPDALVKWLRSPSANGAQSTARLYEFSPGDRIPEGERKKAMVSLAGSLHARGMAPRVITLACAQLDEEQCDPPLGAREVARLVATVTKKPRIGPGAPKLRVVAPDEAPAVPEGEEWSAQLRRKKSRALESTFGNACLLLRHAEGFAGRLGYDDMALTPTWDGVALSDEMLGELRERLERVWGLVLGPDTMAAAAFKVGCEKRVHPLRAYLEGLVWDGAPRLDTLARRALHVEDTLAARMVRRWMIAAVARGLRPGCKVDCVLVLIGAQGGGKSTFFKALAGEGWFGDSPIDITNKDAVLQLRASWVYELAEIDGLTSRRHADQVKAFATIGTDLIRPPYARAMARYPRSSVFCGTTNREDFLTDPSGARRFWLVSVPDLPVEHTLVTEERDQLWAEAVAAFRDDESWWLDPADELALRARAREHMSADSWSEIVQAWLKGRTSPPTCADILTGALRFADVRDIKKEHETRIGQIMSALGYYTRQRTRDGVRVRLYLRDVDGEPPVDPPQGAPPDGLHNLHNLSTTSEVGCSHESRSENAGQPTCTTSKPVPDSAGVSALLLPPFPKPVVQVVQVGCSREKPGEDAAQPTAQPRVGCAAPPARIAPWSKPGAA